MPASNKKIRPAITQVIQRTAKNLAFHGAGKSAAALAYYFLFAMFPLLIFISNLLGLLQLNIDALIHTVQAFIPKNVIELLVAYLDHVSQTSSHTLLWFSLVFTIWFPLRAIRGLTKDVRKAYGLQRSDKPLRQELRQLVFTIVFLLLIVAVLLLSVFGQRVIAAILRWIPTLRSLSESKAVLTLWQYLRFVIAAGIMFIAVSLLHFSAQDERKPLKQFFPGVAASLVGWLSASIGFSFYVENVGRYSVIYGALGTVVVLLIWLYLTAFMLILGAEFNAVLIQRRSKLLQKA